MQFEQWTVIPGKRRRWLRITTTTLAVILLLVSGVAAYLYFSVKGTADKMYQPLPKDKTPYISQDLEVTDKVKEAVELESLTPFSILLLGVDQRAADRGRSDTIIVLTVNPTTGHVFMFNIPRDTRTRLVKRGFDDKINHAYAYDGIAGSLQTVEHFLDMPINYYVEVNMEGFKTIVDLLDGISVVNPFSFKYEGQDFPEGPLHLNGESALKFSRMRYDDPRGDFGRNERQRQIVTDVIKRAGSWNGVMELPNILKQLGGHVKTNLTFNQMRELFSKYRTRIQDVMTTEIHGRGTRINGIYYYLVDEQEILRVHNEMKLQIIGTGQ